MWAQKVKEKVVELSSGDPKCQHHAHTCPSGHCKAGAALSGALGRASPKAVGALEGCSRFKTSQFPSWISYSTAAPAKWIMWPKKSIATWNQNFYSSQNKAHSFYLHLVRLTGGHGVANYNAHRDRDPSAQRETFLTQSWPLWQLPAPQSAPLSTPA